MRYFTKAMYEKMQVYGYLQVAPHLNEQSEELKEWYITQGRDYRSEVRQHFLLIEPLLLKYLPDFRVSAIFAQFVAETEGRSEELTVYINQMAKDHEKAWEETCRNSWEEYQEIRVTLPQSFTVMREKHDLHDAKIISVNSPEDSSVIVILDGKSSLGLCGTGYLTFEDVLSYEIPEGVDGDWWLYDEVHLTPEGHVDFRALLHANSGSSEEFVHLHELRIIAKGFKFALVRT
ncbi:DUF4085 family protein [Paenibacillus planticolens]|uniref:DUF4085 family protein n=1 Tax=Paenibacillus planticolens TaxID=2654976 RepID=A0ABX1ZRH3_9BACL|nr:DUF4085 family protein [Paenibacillus planticolens]NOV01200.1 DUF4085 family protein [Paenibacillus planticolens]